MRLTTYVFRDIDPSAQKAKLVIAAELEPPSTGTEDLTIGHVLYDRSGNVVTVGQERKIYSANTDRPLRYEMTVAADPGVYQLRVGAVDLAGHSGSVEREVQVWSVTGRDVALGDLMLANVHEATSGTVRPPVVAKVSDGKVAAFTELYTNKPGSLDASTVAFDVAEDADAPALTSDSMRFRPRDDGTSAQASAVLSVSALPAGSYVLRATISISGHPVGKLVRPFIVTGTTGESLGLVPMRTAGFSREEMLAPALLGPAFDAMEKNHPLAKKAIGKARTGEFAGTALLALDAGDESASALLRGLETFSKGQLDQAATQFTVAMRVAPDSSVAAFFLGACYASAGRDREALNNWERARAANLPVPQLPVLIANAYFRMGDAPHAIDPLVAALQRQPQDDAVRKTLAVAQSQAGRHEDAYATVTPYLERHAADADALLIALQAIYQVHAGGKSIAGPAEDKAAAAKYARAYSAAGGPNQTLVDKWLKTLEP
jgi:Flp pilus assembly protein TadD